MTITDELKKLYSKWTGETPTGETVEELLAELNADYTPGDGSGSGGSVIVDSVLDVTSENPVQNKVIKDALDALQAAIEAVNNDYKVTLTVDSSGDAPALTTTKSVRDIYEAAAAGKHVYAELDLGIRVQRFELHQFSALGELTRGVQFYAVQVDEDGGTETPKPVCVKGENTGRDDVWTVVG